MFKLYQFLLLALGSYSLADEIISSDLLSQVRQQGLVNITVSFYSSSISSIQDLEQIVNRTERLNALYDTLTEEADQSQEGVLNIFRYGLSTNTNVQIHRLWITNQIVIRNADEDLIQTISEDPQVSSIEEEEIYELSNPVESVFDGEISNQIQWGIRKIQAPEAWNFLGGRNGNGVIVGILDSGVRRSHEALRDNYLGSHGWYDPSRRTTSPNDQGGHGTHVAGTIVGSRGIGVAPGARWSACVGCPNYCPFADIAACGQFFLCPTLPNGSGRDCSKAPHVINNSWGGGRGTSQHNAMIDAWRRAGIIPVFSIGNSGATCNTANSPGDNPNVIGVGATTERDAIAGFSSTGPTAFGTMKPDISAPGSPIVSAGHRADNAYVGMQGTSMASPHVAGVIALMKSRNIRMSFDDIRRRLLSNADQNLSFGSRNCGGRRENVFPNHVFGYGRVNALRSVRAV